MGLFEPSLTTNGGGFAGTWGDMLFWAGETRSPLSCLLPGSHPILPPRPPESPAKYRYTVLCVEHTNANRSP